MKLILSIIISLFSLVFSQDYVITEYRNQDQLANQNFFDGTIGPEGKLYFLARNDIISFDGTEFKSVISINSKFRTSNNIVKDESNNIWFFSGNENSYLIKYDSKAFTKIKFPKNIPLVKSFAVFKGNVFCGTDKGEIYIYQNSKWKKTKLPNELLGSEITQLRVIDGKLFISTTTGMGFYDDFLLSSFNSITRKPVHGFCYDNNEKMIYSLMNKAIGLYKNGNFKLFQNNIDVVNANQFNIYINQIGETEIAFGTGHSHYIFDITTQNFELLNNRYKIKDYNSAMAFKDRFKNIWIVSMLGLTKITESTFTTLKKEDGLFENDVTAIAQFQNGDKILGHKKGMTLIKNNKIIRVPAVGVKSSRKPHIMELVVDSKQRLWFLIQHEGIGRIDNINEPQKVKWFRNEEYLNFHSMIKLNNDEMFIAAEEAFLKINNDSLKLTKKLSDDDLQYHRRLINVSDSIIAIAGGLGLSFFNHYQNKITDRFYKKPFNLYAVSKYRNSLLVGGREGLFKFENGEIQKFIGFGKEINSEVYFINNVENKNEVWIGTNNGVYKWKDNKLKNLQTFDGLPDNETNRSAFVYDKRSDEVWIGTIGGVAIYDESKDIYTNKKQELKIDSIFTSNQTFTDSFYNIESTDGEIGLFFSTISLYNNPEINYQITIFNDDSTFTKNYLTTENNYRIQNLSTDNYVIEISSLDRFGNKSEKIPISLKVNRSSAAVKVTAIILGFFFLVMVYLMVIRKRKAKLSTEQSKNALISEEKAIYSINLFGNLTILSNDLKPILNKFSPQSKELFLLLLLNSINGNNIIKGISSEKMSVLLWPESSKQNTKNKRNVAVKRLRELLAETNLGEVIFEDNSWFLRLNENIFCDYYEWYSFRNKFNRDGLQPEQEITKFLAIVKKGNFLNDVSYSWLEEITAWSNNESVRILSSLIRNTALKTEFRMEAGQILILIDPLNETEMKFYLNLLHKNEKHSQAAYIYDKFSAEYESIFSKKYNKDLDEIISELNK